MLTDQRTADAFANSWNNLPAGSVYTRDQFTDWMSPLTAADVAGRQVLELGCGAGVASLCVGWRTKAVLTGLELQPAYADLARRNATQNGIDFDVHEGDLAQMPSALRAMSFDHVIANPPYFPAASGTAASSVWAGASAASGLASAAGAGARGMGFCAGTNQFSP